VPMQSAMTTAVFGRIFGTVQFGLRVCEQIGLPDIVWLPFVGSPGQPFGLVQLGGSCGRNPSLDPFLVDGGRTAGGDWRTLYANSVYAITVDVSTAYLDTRGSASYFKSTGSAHS
jgi:hypothetical protein